MPYEYGEVTERTITGFTCDRCKRFFGRWDSDIGEFEERFSWQNTGGYFSKFWGDGSSVEVVMCERCGYEMFKEIATWTDGGE